MVQSQLLSPSVSASIWPGPRGSWAQEADSWWGCRCLQEPSLTCQRSGQDNRDCRNFSCPRRPQLHRRFHTPQDGRQPRSWSSHHKYRKGQTVSEGLVTKPRSVRYGEHSRTVTTASWYVCLLLISLQIIPLRRQCYSHHPEEETKTTSDRQLITQLARGKASPPVRARPAQTPSLSCTFKNPSWLKRFRKMCLWHLLSSFGGQVPLPHNCWNRPVTEQRIRCLKRGLSDGL